MLNCHKYRGFSLKWEAAGKHFIEYHTRRVKIRAAIHLAAFCLLWGNVVYRTQCLLCQSCLSRTGQTGNPKICNLHASVPENQNVLGLDIPMNDTTAVGMPKGPQDLGNEMNCLPPVQRSTALLHILLQRHTVNQFHDNIIQTIRMADIIDRDNIDVGEHGNSLRLIMEPAAKIRVFCQFWLQNLDCHQSVEPMVPALVDHSHASDANAFQNLISVVEHFTYVLIHGKSSLLQLCHDNSHVIWGSQLQCLGHQLSAANFCISTSTGIQKLLV